MTTARPRSRPVAADTAAEDRECVRRIAAGDETAFEELHSRYRARCTGLARRLLLDEHLAEDAVQMAFLDVWARARAFDSSRATVGAWITTITHHKAVDLVRSEQARRRRATGSEALLTLIPSSAPSADSVVNREEERLRVLDALHQLTPCMRETLLLAYYGEHTYVEIAAILDLPLGTVKSRGRLALQALRSLLRATAMSATTSAQKA